MIKLTILSPERRLVDGQTVEEVTLPSSEGEIQVLPGHVPMLGALKTGVFSYRVPNNPPSVGVITTGFFEVANDTVTVMAETLELKGEIDTARAKAAQEKAESTLREADLDEHKFKKYQLKLQRSLVRQQTAARSE